MRDNQRLDTRIQRTYRLLREAFLKLTETKDIDEIGITEICDAAMVHRATFYNHFDDKDDFVRYVVRSSAEQIISDSHKQADAGNGKRFSDTLVLNFLDFAQKHSRLILDTAHNGVNGAYFYESMYGFFSDELKIYMARDINDSADKERYERAFCHFLTGGSLALTQWWLSGESEFTTKEQLIQQIKTVFRSLLAART